MDIVLLIVAIALMLVGIGGSFLPILPGPPLCYAGFLCVHFSTYAQFSTSFLITWAIVVVILGIFIPPQPLWLILGPFAGAFLGELWHDARNTKKAFRSAWGSFIGFLAGTFVKIITVIVMSVVFIIEVV